MSNEPILSTPATEPVPAVPTPSGPIVARRGNYYRNARLILVAFVFGFGLWSVYDGFYAWPKKNTEIDQVNKDLSLAVGRGDTEQIGVLGKRQKELGDRHSDLSINLNRILSVALPIFSLGYLVYFLYRSRGEVRYDADTLHMPGHPPVPVDAIQSLDKRLWDKKGIAFLTYSSDSKRGILKLDDFVYEQKPIDAIYDIVKARVEGRDRTAEATSPLLGDPITKS